MPVAKETQKGAPTSELGSSQPRTLIGGTNDIYIDELENVPELQWPKSAETYKAMRNDGQINGLIRAITLPVEKFRWKIDPNGSRPEVYEGLARDFNLPIKGQEAGPQGRSKNRFSHKKHLHHALLAPVYGVYFFEQVGEISEDLMWHLRKLAPRPSFSITDIMTDDQGGLKGIRQSVGLTPTEIPVSRLVAYVWDQEGANWSGRSLLRSVYRNWLIKDRLLRVDAMKHERNGIGVPVMEAPPGATPAEIKALDQMAQKFKAGDASGGAVPNGTKLTLVSTMGMLPDTMASVRDHNEEMAQNFLAMFMKLGQTETGSRALGDNMVDFFDLALRETADWYCDITNEHVIEDWVDWNFGEDEEYSPLITYEKDDDPELAISELVSLIQSGAIQVDNELEDYLRSRGHLPERGTPRSTPSPVPPVGASGKRHGRAVRAAENSALTLPDRPLRRQPYDTEVKSAADFSAMEKLFVEGNDNFVATWTKMLPDMYADLASQIEAAGGDIKKLSEISATPLGSKELADEMYRIADESVAIAMGEAESQGVKFNKQSLKDLKAGMVERAEAVASIIARSVSETAARKAVQIASESGKASELAAAVTEYLSGLSWAVTTMDIGAAMTQAINTGRREVMREGNPVTIYASELLDENTCEFCTDIDGTEYGSLTEAEADYPAGGYVDCAGGGRCRGTLVAVYDEAQATK